MSLKFKCIRSNRKGEKNEFWYYYPMKYIKHDQAGNIMLILYKNNMMHINH